MSTRKVKIYSTKTGKVNVINTDATFWGQLCTELEDKGWFNPSTMKAVDKDSKETFAVASRSIPLGEFTLFLIPTKNDSGYEFTEEDLDDIADKVVASVFEIVEEAKNTVAEEENLAAEADDIIAELL